MHKAAKQIVPVVSPQSQLIDLGDRDKSETCRSCIRKVAVQADGTKPSLSYRKSDEMHPQISCTDFDVPFPTIAICQGLASGRRTEAVLWIYSFE